MLFLKCSQTGTFIYDFKVTELPSKLRKVLNEASSKMQWEGKEENTKEECERGRRKDRVKRLKEDSNCKRFMNKM